MKLTWDLRSGQAGSGRPWNSLTSKTGPLEEWQASKRPLRQEWDDVWGVVRLSSDPYKCSHPRCVSLHTCMHAHAQTHTHTQLPWCSLDRQQPSLPSHLLIIWKKRKWLLCHLTDPEAEAESSCRAIWHGSVLYLWKSLWLTTTEEEPTGPPRRTVFIQEPLSFRRFTRWKGRLSRLDFLFIAN